MAETIPQEKEPGQMAFEAMIEHAATHGVTGKEWVLNWHLLDDLSKSAWAAVEAAIRADERERLIPQRYACEHCKDTGVYPTADGIGHHCDCASAIRGAQP